jgi:hypothetical protein
MKTIYKQCILEIVQAYCTEEEWKLIEKKFNKNLKHLIATNLNGVKILVQSKTPYGILRVLNIIPDNPKEKFGANLIERFEQNYTLGYKIKKKYNL